MMAGKSAPISLRLDADAHAALLERAAELKISVGTLARSLVQSGLQSALHTELERLRDEVALLQTKLLVLQDDSRHGHRNLCTVNRNLRTLLRSLPAIVTETSGEEMNEDLALALVIPLEGEEDQ